jgi:tetratricopeptide (TPR) repeat protein
MNRKNNVIKSTVFIFLLAIVVYLGGCASAETNSGKIAFQNKDYEKAAVELKKGLAINSNDGEGWYMLGVSLIETGKYQEGGEALSKSLSISNSYANNIVNYYISTFNTGINKFNAAAKQYSSDSAGGIKSFGDATNYFIAATYIFPDSIAAKQMLADSYVLIGKTSEALNIYTTILDKSKSEADALQIAKLLYQSGISSMDSKNFETAANIFDKIVGIKYLPHDNQYYEVSVYNAALARMKMAEKMIEDNGSADVSSYMNSVVSILEPFVETSKNNDLLKSSYDLLIIAYDALGNDSKRDAAQEKRNSL